MKPPPKQEAQRWLSQADHVLKVATTLSEAACYAESCFHAEQTGQLALKAFLYGQGERDVRIHSVKELVERCATYDPAFAAVIDGGKILDQYYIPTRYPDALADPAVPFESYTRDQASQALAYARDIVERVKRKVV